MIRDPASGACGPSGWTRLALVFGVLLLQPEPGSAAPTGRPVEPAFQRTVSVPGDGEANAAPDEVTFTLGVTREGAEARHARMDLQRTTSAVLAALAQRGVTGADVRTAAISLAPNDRFEAGKRLTAGYRATTAMTVTLRSLELYDGVLAAAMQAGANEFQGALFGSSRQADLETRARAAAVADAKRRAEALAAAAGATLGRIVSIAEGHVERPPVPMTAALRSMGGGRHDLPPGGPSLAGGEITVRVSIQATWALE